jgi:hypothetical protein
VADNILKIFLQTIAKGKGAEVTAKDLGRVEKAAKAAGARLGKDIVGAAKIAGPALIGIGIASIKLASDAEEMQGKFDTVFKTVGEDVTRALDDFSEAAGRNRFELRGMAAELGDLFKPLGFAEEEAGDLSVQMVKLATDLGSFNNMPMSDALDRLRGTLVGSHENALAFGVVINESTIKAELAAKGWDKLTGAALNQAKVQIRLNLLMKGTTDAQGDAVKTSDSFANRLVRLQSNAEELGVSIGQKLLPVALELVNGLNTLITAGDQANDVLISMAQTGDAFEKAGASAALLTTGTDRLTEAFEQNKAQMFEMVLAGEMTVEEFNRNVEATRAAADEWGRAEGGLNTLTALVRDESVPAQQELTAELVEAVRIGRELEASDRALIQARGSLKNVTAEIVPTEAELAEAEDVATEAAKAQAAAAREQAESLEAARQKAADTSVEFTNLAQSLIDATNADLAKVALDNLAGSLESGEITQGEFKRATEDVMLTFGLATEKSLTMATSLGDVNKLYEDGKISADEYTDIIGELNDSGGDLETAMDTLGLAVDGVNVFVSDAEALNRTLMDTQGDQIEVTEDLTEKTEDMVDAFSDLKDSEFAVAEASGLAGEKVGDTVGPLTASDDAAQNAAASWERLNAAMQSSGAAGVPDAGVPPAPGFQHGGNIGRFGIVGEQGPELVVGNRVFSNPQTDRLIAAIETLVNAFPSSMGTTTNNNINFPAGMSAAQAGAHTRALIGGGRR